jgi:hypothetical protein
MGFDLSGLIAQAVHNDLPANQFLGLDGKAYPFEAQSAQPVAMSAHESMFYLTRDYGWGTRWYALHVLHGRFVFTVGFGMWCARREVPEDAVPDIMARCFTRSELTETGRQILSQS